MKGQEEGLKTIVNVMSCKKADVIHVISSSKLFFIHFLQANGAGTVCLAGVLSCVSSKKRVRGTHVFQ